MVTVACIQTFDVTFLAKKFWILNTTLVNQYFYLFYFT